VQQTPSPSTPSLLPAFTGLAVGVGGPVVVEERRQENGHEDWGLDFVGGEEGREGGRAGGTGREVVRAGGRAWEGGRAGEKGRVGGRAGEREKRKEPDIKKMQGNVFF